MTQSNKTQLTLTVIILFLTMTGLLYGWIYASSLQYKFDSLVLNPQFIEKDEISRLKNEQLELKDKIKNLETALQNFQSTTQINIDNQTPILSNKDTNINFEQKIDVFVDSKCFEDSTNLNQCSVFGSYTLKDDFRLVIKPIKEITKDINEIAFEFLIGDKKYTEIKTSTANLLDTSKPIASIAFIGKNDITIQTEVGLNSNTALYNFDGNSWIDLTKYSSQ